MRAPNIREATLARLRRAEGDRANRAVTVPTQSADKRDLRRPAACGPTDASSPLAGPSTPQALQIIAPATRTAAQSGGGVGLVVAQIRALIRLMDRGIMCLHHPSPRAVVSGDTFARRPIGSQGSGHAQLFGELASSLNGVLCVRQAS